MCQNVLLFITMQESQEIFLSRFLFLSPFLSLPLSPLPLSCSPPLLLNCQLFLVRIYVLFIFHILDILENS